jgi:hypothetical protein
MSKNQRVLHELGPAVTWLSQFKIADVRGAEALVRHLRLVSFAEFEEGIATEIERLYADTSGRIALFPVDKKPGGEARLPSSADRIGYTLTSLERRFGDRLRVRPSIESMRAEKMKHVILVDDFVGTGGRVIKYWNSWASPSLKSWLSYHKMQLWLLVYAAHDGGAEKIIHRITYLSAASLRCAIPLPRIYTFPNERVLDICDSYGKLTGKPKAARGVGGLMSPIIFQHGCPNNAPAILWANGRGWKALFPNRAVPPELYPCFGDTQPGTRNAELLWKTGQYRLALELINSAYTTDKAKRQQTLLVILGLLARRRRVVDLPKLMTIETRIIESIVRGATRSGLLDAHGSVTDFGFDLLSRARRGHRGISPKIEGARHAIESYYPKQLFGVQRKSSNEPE